MSADQFAIQFKESKLGVARYEALDSLVAREAKDQLLEILPMALKDSFWSVRENVLGFLQNDPEWREQVDGLEETVYELAENDPKNTVRAAALDLLATWDPERYQPTFLRLANDSSYLIASSALMGLVSATESPVDPAIIGRFEKEGNFRISIPVAEYYIQQEVTGKGQWFMDRLAQSPERGFIFSWDILQSIFHDFRRREKTRR